MMEIRSFQTELRATGPMKLGGIAVPWESLSRYVFDKAGYFQEKFARGAFNETLASNDDVLLLWSHNHSMPISSRASGNLLLRDDPDGLHFDGVLNDTSWSKDAYAAVAAGTVRVVSFGFQCRSGDDSWEKYGANRVRTVHRAALREISPVPMASYEATSVGVRSIEDMLGIARADPGIIARDLLAESIALEIERGR